MPKREANGPLCMECPFCGKAASIKACVGQSRGAKGQAWYWRCACQARGFIPDEHFRALDRLRKISIASLDS